MLKIFRLDNTTTGTYWTVSDNKASIDLHVYLLVISFCFKQLWYCVVDEVLDHAPPNLSHAILVFER